MEKKTQKMKIQQKLAVISSAIAVVAAAVPNVALADSASQTFNGGEATLACFINSYGRLAPWSLNAFDDSLVALNMTVSFVPNGPVRSYFFGILPQNPYYATADSNRAAISAVLSGSALGIINAYNVPAFVAKCT